MSEIILSIIIPVKNEVNYLQELLDEVYHVKNDDIEIIISDNYSDDGSWELLLKQTKYNIRLVRPPSSCNPFENHKYALDQAKGKYVFSMGGDDIFLSDCLKQVMPLLRKYDNNIVIGRVKVFNDITKELIEKTNDPKIIRSFFDNEIFSIKRYLDYINFDEMFFSFFPRENQGFMDKLEPLSYETFASWVVMHNYYFRNLDEVIFLNEVILMKRTALANKSGNFNQELGISEPSNNIKKFIGTVKNSINFIKINFDIKVFFYLLFRKRKALGDYGSKRIHSPFVHVIGSQTLILMRKICRNK